MHFITFLMGLILYTARSTGGIRVEFSYSKWPDIVFTGHTLSAQCSLCDSNFTSLMWVIVRGKRTVELTTDHAFVLVMEETPGVRLCEAKDSNFTLDLRMAVTPELDGIQIACMSSDHLGDPCWIPEVFCQPSQVFRLQRGPEAPSLFQVLSDQDMWALETRTLLTVRCVACVGSDSEARLVWALEGETWVEQISARTRLVRRLTEESEMSACGPVINSTITIRASKELQGTRLACYSFDFLDPRYSFPGKNNMSDRTDTIGVIERENVEEDGQDENSRHESFVVATVLFCAAAILIIVTFGEYDDDVSEAEDLPTSLEDLWRVKPDVLQMTPAPSGIKWHGILDPGPHVKLSPSLYVSVPSSLMLLAASETERRRVSTPV